MKKTLTINLGGSVFHIEDDAYLKLDQYLESLKQSFKNDPEGEEIISDIEGRMAEIFLQEIENDTHKAVTIVMVELAIETLGTPDDIADNTDEKSTTNNPNKRLYRDANRKVFGGVCSGLANYLKMDALLMRILFVVVLLATSGGLFFVYLVLWLAVPEARSVSQQMEMRGERVNVSSIEKKVKSDKQTKGKPAPSGPGIGETILKIIAWIIGGFLIFVLIIVVLALLAALFGLTVASSVLSGFLPEIFVPGHFFMNVPADMLSHTTSSAIGMILFIGAPILLILFIISKVFFKHNGKVGWVILLSMGLWIAGIVLLATSSIKLIHRAAEMNIDIVGNDDRGAIVIDGDTILSFQEEANDHFKMKIKSRNSGALEFDERNNTVYISRLFTANDTLTLTADSSIPTLKKEGDLVISSPVYRIVSSHEENFRMVLELENYHMKYANFQMKNPIFRWKDDSKTLELHQYITARKDDQEAGNTQKVVLEIPQGMHLVFKDGAEMLFENLNQEEQALVKDGQPYALENNTFPSTH